VSGILGMYRCMIPVRLEAYVGGVWSTIVCITFLAMPITSRIWTPGIVVLGNILHKFFSTINNHTITLMWWWVDQIFGWLCTDGRQVRMGLEGMGPMVSTKRMGRRWMHGGWAQGVD
jgi:hypothetical protein